MSRPVKGDTRVQQYRRTLKNGVIYVYEREVKYNPETRRNDTLSNKLIGKILPDTNGTMIETKFRTPPFEYAEKKKDNDQGAQKEGDTENESKDKLYSSISRYHMGMMSILEWVGKLLISLEKLEEEGLLSEEDVRAVREADVPREERLQMKREN